MIAALRRDRFALAVGAVSLVMAVLVCWRSVVWSWGADSGTFYEAIRHAAGGFGDGPEGGSHLHFHWSPVLALLWPATLVPSVLAIQFLQLAAVIATALVLRALIRPYFGGRVASLAGLAALLYPPLLAIGFEEFHELGFWPVLALTILWAADRERWIAYGLAVVAAVLLREDVALLVAMLGAVLAVIGTRQRGRRRALHYGRTPDGLLTGRPFAPQATTIAGVLTMIAALASLGVYYGLVVPRVGGWAPSHFYDYGFAHGPLQTVGALFTRPFDVLHVIATRGRLTYVLEALLPGLVLWSRTRWTLLAVPGLAICLLSTEEIAWRMGGHYVALWAPFVVLGTALGAATLRFPERWLRASAIVCGLWLIVSNPMHPAHYLQARYPDRAAAEAALACVPSGAAFSTHDDWYSAVVPRRPGATIERDDAPFLVYADDYDNAHFQGVLRPAVERAVAAGRYTVVCATRHARAYRKLGG